jgi:hypothetical protein
VIKNVFGVENYGVDAKKFVLRSMQGKETPSYFSSFYAC